MSATRKQFTIGSLMILIAIVGVFLAFPAVTLTLCVILSLPFLFLAFLAGPLILLEWLEAADQGYERRKFLRNSSAVDVEEVVAGEYRLKARPIESRS